MRRLYCVVFKRTSETVSGSWDEYRYFDSEKEALVFYRGPDEQPGRDSDRRLLATTRWTQVLPVSDNISAEGGE